MEAEREDLMNRISNNTIAYRIAAWIDNFKANLPAVQGGYGVISMINALDRVPAIIVGSGPTLDWNIDELRAVQNSACIIACDSAVKALLAHGITPHLVLVTDSKARVGGFFADVDTAKLNFIVDTFVHPTVVDVIKGRTYWYNTMPVEKCAFTGALNQWTGATGNLGTGGCVATTAWWFASQILRCDPTILVGMPEAMYDPRQMYAQCVNSTVDTEPYNAQAIKTKDIFGNDCYTFLPLQSFAYWFEDAFLNIQGIHINCSEGGILQRNVLNMPLIACIERYLQPSFDIEAMLFCKEMKVDELLAQCDNDDMQVHRPMMTTLLDGPSLPNLALRMGMEESELHGHIDTLRDAGFVITEHRNESPDGEVVTMVYTLTGYGSTGPVGLELTDTEDPVDTAATPQEVSEAPLVGRIETLLSSRGGKLTALELASALDSNEGLITQYLNALVAEGRLVAEQGDDIVWYRSKPCEL